MRSCWLIALLPFIASGCLHAVGTIAWPTPNPAFFEGGGVETWAQPTASGKLESALFGCVRNNGTRFHEAIDIKALSRDRRGEATDSVFAAMAGRVAHINEIAGNSSFGRYVVLEHPGGDLSVYTLYSHLKNIDSSIEVGTRVQAGARLGTMGRSAGGYSIPRSRAHLHFEIGLRLSDDFQSWYDEQGFGSKNLHGNFNGMNLSGADPLRFYETVRSGRLTSLRDYFRSLPTAFVLRVSYPEVPDFIQRYPQLLTRPMPTTGLLGWDVAFTWYGLPKAWTPLSEADGYIGSPGKITLKYMDPDKLGQKCRRTIYLENGQARMGSALTTTLELLFGFHPGT